jgi:small multidrug resistance pump
LRAVFTVRGGESIMRPYLVLALAIVSEVAGTTALKLSDGFANLVPSVGVVVGYLASFYFLGLVLEELPVGLVYATWAAVGIVGTVGVGLVVFDESLDLAAVAGLALVIAGVVVLNVFSRAYSPAH